jgi:hypothetical protein
MGGTGTQLTPWVYEAQDNNGRVLRITVTFNNASRALQSAAIFRDVGCAYGKIYIGVGADGLPDSTPRSFNVPHGDTVFNAAQMSAVGLDTIEDILARQITAGP